jgi:hypothetical protein
MSTTLRLHPEDGVVIARTTLMPGAPVTDGIQASDRIPAGHKVAVPAPLSGPFGAFVARSCAPRLSIRS